MTHDPITPGADATQPAPPPSTPPVAIEQPAESDPTASGASLGRGLLVASYVTSLAMAPVVFLVWRSISVFAFAVFIAFALAWVTRLFDTGWPERRWGRRMRAQVTAFGAAVLWVLGFYATGLVFHISDVDALRAAAPGDCLTAPAELDELMVSDELNGFVRVDCTEPHWGQVYAVLYNASTYAPPRVDVLSEDCFNGQVLEALSTKADAWASVVPIEMFSEYRSQDGTTTQGKTNAVVCIVTRGGGTITGDYYVGS